MIKLDVTSTEHGDDLKIVNSGKISGRREIVAQEMAAVLKEFHSLDGGQTLIVALDTLMEELINDKR